MVLKPLEFSDCLSDSPWFRQNLHAHEAALEKAYKNIKNIELQCRELVACTKKLSQAQKAFANSLAEFEFETVGTTQTDDERVIATCLKEFAKLINQVEEERTKILNESESQYLEPLKRFRTEAIGKTLHDEKRKYEKESSKFYTSLEKHLHLSTVRKNDFREADAQLDLQQQYFCQASLQYVAEIQSVQERMKFEFVETLSSFLYSWLTFYHVGHVIHEDFKPFLDSVQVRVQKTKESFKATQDEAKVLKEKMLKTHTKIAGAAPSASTCLDASLRASNAATIKQGYVYMQEKSKMIPKTIGRDVLKGNWTKYYAVYSKETRIFTMIPVNTSAKTDMKGALGQSTSFKLKECLRRSSDSIDKRFCFDLVADERPDVMTFQALSEEDRRQWLDAMDGKQPIYSPGQGPSCSSLQTQLDDNGFDFVEHCIESIDNKGIREQGLYRNCGVTSKVQKLMQIGLDKRKASADGGRPLNLQDDSEWETKTVSSAVKTFLRNLPEPLMTFELHNVFINAAKMDDRRMRVNHIHYYVYRLPDDHKKMLEMVIRHLRRVADRASENLMTVGNLGVCFGPTLLRPKEETMAAIMDIKFCNVVVEVLIANCDEIFNLPPPKSIGTPCPPKPDHQKEEEEGEGEGRESRTDNGSGRSAAIAASASGRPRAIVAASASAGSTPSRSAVKAFASVPTGSATTTHPVTEHASVEATMSARLVPAYGAACSSSAAASPSPTTPPAGAGGAGGAGEQHQHRSVRGAGDSSDSLNSILSAGSESSRGKERGGGGGGGGGATGGDAHMPRVSAKISSSYAPAYNPLACESIAHRLKKRHSGGDLLSSSPHQPTTHQQLRAAAPFSGESQDRVSPLYTYIHPAALQPSRRVKTLYACVSDHDSELSFEPGQIITNVHESKEEGWLVGTLNGKTGLIPANYVEPLQ